MAPPKVSILPQYLISHNYSARMQMTSGPLQCLKVYSEAHEDMSFNEIQRIPNMNIAIPTNITDNLKIRLSLLEI